jgi:nucleotidyltransferase/DNA polymerase involved in DNA repair
MNRVEGRNTSTQIVNDGKVFSRELARLHHYPVICWRSDVTTALPLAKTEGIKSAMNRPNARRKLEEAKFFFGELQKHTNEDSFLYYVSAFLSAAYSVVEVARKGEKQDLVKKNDLSDWKTSLSEEEKNLYETMRGQRRKDIHHGKRPISKESKVAKAFSIDAQVIPRNLIFNRSAQIEWTTGGVVVTIPQVSYHFSIKNAQETTPVVCCCRKYLAVLEKFIAWKSG